MDANVRAALAAGLVIPALPLALDANRAFDERRQRALLRYYAAAGAGGVAAAVHTTQFAIRRPDVGLFEPLLALVAEEADRADRRRATPLLRVVGVCGDARQAVAEASLARDRGFHAALLVPGQSHADEEAMMEVARQVADVMPIVGFYLQPAVGGHVLSHAYWRRFAEIENVVAIKIAPFNRYQTLDVVRAVVDADRDDIALYTGNDDNIVVDLVTPYRVGREPRTRRIVGGLLGHWAVWTRAAVELHERCRAASADDVVPSSLLRTGVEVTDANAAFFDAAHGFAGCIAGIHEVLRRQGLLEGTWCLDPDEGLSPGQLEEIDRVYRAYPALKDDDFVAAHRDEWLSG